MRRQRAGESLRPIVVIFKNHLFAKLDARLYNHANHIVPGIRQFLVIKSRSKDFQGVM